MDDPRRRLPSVGALLQGEALRPLLDRAPRGLVADAVRDAVDAARLDPATAPSDEAGWSRAVGERLARLERPSLRRAFNATGVVLHTNLGRAPLAADAVDAIREVALASSNLEYDLDEGARGDRYRHCAALLRELTGAEDAIVVNNCAAALVLALDTFARSRDAVVSRGELVEIGGSFRVPDIMAKSGARLAEVGTTNRTHVDDYRRAIGPETGAIVKVHRSNFSVQGFVAEVEARDLAALAREASIPLLHDFGSGLLISLEAWGLRGEPTARDAVAAGATLVLMSGDKMLGGPQAGLVVGTAAAVGACRRNPLARALRVDKLTLAALEATLRLYREPARAVREVPALAMLTASAEETRERAARLGERLRQAGVRAEVVDAEAGVGGGAFPTARIPSAAVSLEDPEPTERRLRAGEPPVIGRISDGRLLLDPRGVPAALDHAFQAAVLRALAHP